MARAIDADNLKKEVKEWTGSATDFRTLEEIIEDQPTIDPVKHGKWIVLGQRAGMRYPTHYCSECGEHGWEEYQYCQHCGAKMDKE